jgi:hypothetical protein
MTSEHFPVIKNGELSKKKLTGKLVLRGTCPACGAALTLTEEEVLKRKDSCPDCRAPFVVGLPEFTKVQALHAAAEEAKEQAIRAREELAAEKSRVAKEQEDDDLRRRMALAKKSRVAKEQEVLAARQKANYESVSSP